MKACVTVIIAIFAIIFLATSIDAYNESFIYKHGLSGLEGDIFYKMFGEFKNYFSYMSYIKADIYYHGGIYHFHKEEEDSGGCLKKETEHVHEDTHVREDEKAHGKIRPSLNILLDIANAAQITEHRHISGKEAKEIVPWIYYAVRLNPHNEMAYAVGGFWLAVKLKKPDEAIRFLKEGLKNNPQSLEICHTLGQIYLLRKKDYKKARDYLETAKELGRKQNADRFEKRKVYTFLAEAYKRLGEKEKSAVLYKELLNLFPGDKSIEKRIAEP